jgi:hypothetical protein
MKLFKNFNQNILFIGLLVLGLLFAFSLAFYRERVMNFDASFFAFLMIDTNNFSIALGRWGAVLAQVLPLMALKSGLSINTFLRLFSVAPIINYTLLFLAIDQWLKNYKASLLFLFTITLCFRHVFYYTTAELYFGLALGVLFLAIIFPSEGSRKIEKNWVYFSVISVLIYVVSYFHQLTVFALLFAVLYAMIWNGDYKNRRMIITLSLTLVWFFIRIFLLKSTTYESEKIPSIHTFLEQLPHLKDLPSTRYYKDFFKQEFLFVFALYSLSLGYFLYRKKWLFVLFNLSYVICFLALILITYYKGESPLMYENYYVLFGFFWGLPIVQMLFEITSQGIKYAVTISLLVVSINGMYQSHYVFTKKIDYLQRLVDHAQQNDHKKFIINSLNFNWRVSWVSWSLPFETALLSADNANAQSASFYLSKEYNKFDSILNRENIFLGPDWAPTWFGSQNLNKRYYHFPSSGYVKLNTSQADTTFHPELFNKENVELIPVKNYVVSDADAFVVVPIKIVNHTEHLLRSIPDAVNQTFLSYHLYDATGKLVDSDGLRSALELDVQQSAITGLTIDLPAKGLYKVVVDFVTENKRWWEVNAEFTLEVK